MIYGFELENEQTNQRMRRIKIAVHVALSSSLSLRQPHNDNWNAGHSIHYPNPLKPISSDIIEAKYWYDILWFIGFTWQTPNSVLFTNFSNDFLMELQIKWHLFFYFSFANSILVLRVSTWDIIYESKEMTVSISLYSEWSSNFVVFCCSKT